MAPDYQNVLDLHIKLTQNHHYTKDSYKIDIKVRYCKDECFLTVNTLIAQVVEVFSQLVNTNKKGQKFISYTEFIHLLVEGYKEQQTFIENQQQEISDLAARIERLEKEIQAINLIINK